MGTLTNGERPISRMTIRGLFQPIKGSQIVSLLSSLHCPPGRYRGRGKLLHLLHAVGNILGDHVRFNESEWYCSYRPSCRRSCTELLAKQATCNDMVTFSSLQISVLSFWGRPMGVSIWQHDGSGPLLS